MGGNEDHDPFPMTSKEAAALAASTTSGTDPSSSWVKMTSGGAPSSGGGDGGKSSTDGTASSSLLKSGSSRSKKKGRGNYKVDIDHDNVDEVPDVNDEDDEDDFLDRPMMGTYSRTRPGAIFLFARDRGMRQFRSSFLRLFRRLYGNDVPLHEVRRVIVLSSTLFFMIGGYWLLRSLKDPVLTALCGVSVIPKAKMTSVIVVLAVVSIYNKLLSSDIPKHKLFYIFGSFYFVLFSAIAFLLTDPVIGLPNEVSSPSRILGWVSYCAIESFGSVMVSLFWSFANSVIGLEGAKASYGLMVATAQIGSILGPTIVNSFVEDIGVAACYLIGAFSMLLLQGTMAIYIHIYGPGDEGPADESAAPPPKKKGAGVLEGLVLFWKHNYIKGIFAISCLFMVEVTIVDFTMKVLAKEHFAELHPCVPGNTCWDSVNGRPQGLSAEATAAFTTFMGLFGQATNTLSFLLSLFGTSAVIRTFGLRLTLLLFPTLCLIIIIMVRLSPTLWIVFAAMMMLKACSYALNNPTKEILYQPTSKAVKFKAKSWIDIFGARGSKALGSVVTNLFSHSTEALVANGSLVGMAVATFLIFNARYMGLKFDEYVKTGYIVGGEDEYEATEAKLIDLPSSEKGSDDDDDEGEGTSCAIYDDSQVGPLEEGQMDEVKEPAAEGKTQDGDDDDDPEMDDILIDQGGSETNKSGSADVIQI